jgi:hypothetical protein
MKYHQDYSAATEITFFCHYVPYVITAHDSFPRIMYTFGRETVVQKGVKNPAYPLTSFIINSILYNIWKSDVL